MTFGERLTELRKENGYTTRNEFADRLKIPSTTLRNYETDAREPGHTFLKQISEMFNVSVDYLLCLTDDKEKVSSYQLKNSEYEHIKKYRVLDDYGHEAVNAILDIEYNRCQLKEDHITYVDPEGQSNLRTLQYFRRIASAGTGQVVFEDMPAERIEIPDIPEYRCVSYAIGVNGDSMEPLYYDGDILLIETTLQVDIGEVGIFIVDGEAFVKQLGEGKLVSLNDKYKDIPLTEHSNCMGRVVGKLEMQ